MDCVNGDQIRPSEEETNWILNRKRQKQVLFLHKQYVIKTNKILQGGKKVAFYIISIYILSIYFILVNQ